MMISFSKSRLLPGVVSVLLLLTFTLEAAPLETIQIKDVQGIVTAKSPTDTRWSPVAQGTELRLGDQIRTGPRGANAARLQFEDGSKVVIGPASSAVIEGNGKIILLRGEFEISPLKKMSITTAAGKVQESSDTLVWRLNDQGELSKVENTPKWLSGFNGINTAETLGSLLAKVDGRDVPLTIGYHHVTVEIRDQIARTTIEQSFVNHTKVRTEGVFYFPLPQDSSIAGFGMWINGELVEADVIEKQRAREIYETILRERRDPGLLEWTGGNIFKARVFPIFPHSEKRVKITYTQVLPLQKDGTFRYRYALQSDMLRENPVRDLKVDLKVSSAKGIESAECTSHTIAQTDVTEFAAHFQLEEQEYTPDADFEVVIKPLPNSAPEGFPISLIPHRRGEDGYFLLTVDMPQEKQEGSSDHPRGLNRKAEPLNLLFLCDTSGSMDPVQRRYQSELISAITSQLGESDRFNLATCDVDCRFWKENSSPPSEEKVSEALGFLEQRISLGWSDLGKTFSDLCESIQPNTQVIYLGDGIPATIQTDPNAFASRLKQSKVPKGVSFFPVATGSKFEPVVMTAISGLGMGSSFRQVSSSNPSTTVAASLLREILQPDYRNLRIEIEGPVKTARIYPNHFVSTEPGEQRIVTGRYLPIGKDQEGSVIISAERNGNEITWEYPLSFPGLDAGHEGGDTGNSFIPRLWARKYLDVLLEQGATPEIREEIVDLSVEYKIMTPYTSFLVLESDADRERFGVKRRFQMRDGERFFSDGKKEANFHLVRQQMIRASEWRKHLHLRTLQNLEGMGRNPNVANQLLTLSSLDDYAIIGHGGHSADYSSFIGINRRTGAHRNSGRLVGDLNGPDVLAVGGNILIGSSGSLSTVTSGYYSGDRIFSSGGTINVGGGFQGTNGAISAGYMTDYVFQGGARLQPGISLGSGGYDTVRGFSGIGQGFPMTPASPLGFAFKSDFDRGDIGFPQEGNAHSLFSHLNRNTYTRDRVFRRPLPFINPSSRHTDHFGRQQMYPAQPGLRNLFPQLVSLSPAPKHSREADAKAAKLVESLARFEPLGKAGVHIKVTRTQEFLRENRVSSVEVTEAVIHPESGSWWFQRDSRGSQTIWHMLHENLYALDRVRGLAREATAEKADTEAWTQLQIDFEEDLDSLIRSNETRVADGNEPNTKWLIILRKEEPVRRILIDTDRNVVLRKESRNSEKEWRVTQETKEFVEFGGLICPSLIVQTPTDKFRRVDRIDYQESEVDFFEERKKELEKVILLRDFPTLSEARKRVDSGDATIDDWIALTDYFWSRQQWDKAEEYLNEFSNAAAINSTESKLALLHFRISLFQNSGQTEKLRTEILAAADSLVASEAAPVMNLLRAQYLLNTANQLQGGELIEIIDRLEPCFLLEDNNESWRQAEKAWKVSRGNALRYWQEISDKEKTDWWRDLATEYRNDLSLHITLIDLLTRSGENEAARGVYELETARDWWNVEEKWRLRDGLISKMMSDGRYDEAANLIAPFIDSEECTRSRFSNYLKALARSGKSDLYSELCHQWLDDYLSSESPGDSPIVENRAFGVVDRLCEYTGRSGQLTVDWAKLLRDKAIEGAMSANHFRLSNQILGNSRFRQSDQRVEAIRAIGEWLVENVEDLGLDHLSFVISNSELSDGGWASVRNSYIKLWRSEEDLESKKAAENLLHQHRSVLFVNDRAALYEFLEERITQAIDEKEALSRRLSLFHEKRQGLDTLSKDEEISIYAMLGDLHLPESESPLVAPLEALLGLNDRVYYSSSVRTRDAEEKPSDEMTREEQAEIQTAIVQTANKSVITHLKREIELRKNDPRWSELLPWMRLERVFFEARLEDANYVELLKECLEWLGDSPAPWVKEKDLLTLALKKRLLATATYLAAKSNGEEPQLTDDLLSFLNKGIALEDQWGADLWQQEKWSLLVATERNETLEKVLKDWAEEDTYNPQWRIALAYLYTEQDQLAEAIAVFESLEADDLLSGEDAETYAALQQAAGKKVGKEITLRGSISESRLYTIIEKVGQIQERIRSKDGGPTGSIEQDDIDLIAELMDRSPYADRYFYQIRQLYRETKDPRIPAPVIRGLLGGSIQQAYPMLRQFYTFAELIEEEASVDEAMTEISRIRADKHQYTGSDLRALDMAEAVLKMRASQVLNQSEQHVGPAASALERAMDRDFERGERSLMADWMKELRSFKGEQIENSIRSSFEKLHSGAEDPFIRLSIAAAWSQWDIYQEKPDRGIDRLVQAIKQTKEFRKEKFTDEMTNALSVLLKCYQGIHHYSEAEDRIQSELRDSVNRSVRSKLIIKACENYNLALRNGNTTSFGEGNSQYAAVRSWMISEFQNVRIPPERNGLVDMITGYHYTASSKSIKTAGTDLRNFGEKEVGPLVELGAKQSGNMVGTIANRIEDIQGPIAGVDFLVGMLEREPRWVATASSHSIWDRCGYSTYRWREDAKNMPADLKSRLLAVLKSTLAEQLTWRGKRYLDFCKKNYSYCWDEKLGEFQLVVEAFIEENSDTTSSVIFGAEFIADHIGNYRKAAEFLSKVNREGKLEREGRVSLGKYLERSEQWAESAGVHQVLIKENQQDITSHIRLTRALFYQDKKDKAAEALKTAGKAANQEGDFIALARLAEEIEELDAAIPHYQTGIRKHESVRADRGIGNGTVSEYYREMAGIHSNLGQTKEAVDAASASIVSWGDNRRERTRSLKNLRSILADASDLDAFAKSIDKEGKESGLGNPVLRKAMGMVYLEAKKPKQAVEHLTLAIELQPGDAETHLKLIEALDAAGDKEAARTQLIEAIKQSPRDFKLIHDLRKRYDTAEMQIEGERAATHLVEATPNESESHHELAKVRMEQQQWNDALGHWRRVAELRKLEPTGLIGQIRTRLAAGEAQEARKLSARLSKEKWHSRFQPEIQKVQKEVEAL